jgi:uncharacterized protein (DUF983 family)
MPEGVKMLDAIGRGATALDEPASLFESEEADPGALHPQSVLEAIRRGLAGRCPKCGSARLFRSFLQPVSVCPACGQDWRTRTADDFPPYLVILAVGHIVAPGMIALESGFHPPLWVHLTVWLPLALLLSFLLIQPLKGAVMAFQWWHWDRTEAGTETPEPGCGSAEERPPAS